MSHDNTLTSRIAEAAQREDIAELRRLNAQRIQFHRQKHRAQEVLRRLDRDIASVANRIADRRMTDLGITDFTPTGSLDQESCRQQSCRQQQAGERQSRQYLTDPDAYDDFTDCDANGGA
jgi:hypothetical protein